MKDRANISLAAFGFLVMLCVMLMLFTGTAFPQSTATNCDHHSDSLERFENIRITPPALITNRDMEQVEYYIISEQSKRTLVGYFHLDDRSDLSDDFKADVKDRKWWLFYCVKCKYLYGAIRYGIGSKRK